MIFFLDKYIKQKKHITDISIFFFSFLSESANLIGKSLLFLFITFFVCLVFFFILFLFLFLLWFMVLYFEIVRATLWFLSPKGRRIQAQRAQHNEFVESGLKN